MVLRTAGCFNRNLYSGMGVVIKCWEQYDPYTTGYRKKFLNIMTNPISQAILPVHIWVSLRRVLIAFFFAIVLGVGLGVGLGWSKNLQCSCWPDLWNAPSYPAYRMDSAYHPMVWNRWDTKDYHCIYWFICSDCSEYLFRNQRNWSSACKCR